MPNFDERKPISEDGTSVDEIPPSDEEEDGAGGVETDIRRVDQMFQGAYFELPRSF